jgi:hypothetical protein
VTAEDVASSFYYLHLNTEDDAQLLDKTQEIILEEDEPDEVVHEPLPRKPLPETAKSSLNANRQSQIAHPEGSVFVDSNTVPPPLPERKPLLVDSTTQVPNQLERIQRKPLGPRPFLPESTDRKPVPGEDGQAVSSNPHDAISTDDVASSKPKAHHLEKVEARKETEEAFSITIIRRDPSSGAQWNVGTVVGEEETPSSPLHSRKPYFDISVLLATPGYGQFRHSQFTQHHNGINGIGKNSAGPELSSAANHSSVKPHHQPAVGSGFVREICMEGSSFWARTRQHGRAQSDIPGTRSITGGPNHNFAAGAQELSHPHGSQDPSDSEPRGYVFTSPWGGRCKFATTSGGRSLHCRHTLPGPISATSGGEFGQDAASVSELRSTAPSNSAKKLVIESRRLSKQKLGHIRNKLSPDKTARPPLPPRVHPASYAALYPSDEEGGPPLLPPRPQSGAYAVESSDDGGETHATAVGEQPDSWWPTEEESRLDLSIGQEKAGGGNRGKRAKLGKLIIYDEGFKMLDLIVAANMGVWWSVWGFDR